MTARRQFLLECGKAAAAFVFMAACHQEGILGARQKRRASVGVSVFCGWADPRPEYGLVPGVQCPVLHPWSNAQANRIPAIGQYNEADPAVTAWRLAEMERGGIEWVTYQHEWSPNLGTLLMNHCAENHPDDAKIQYAFSWWDVLSNSSDGELYYANQYFSGLPDWTKESVEQSLRAYGRAIQPFTRKASYLRVGDRPVLFRGGAQSLEFYGRFGISPVDVLQLISEAFPERPYWVATATDPEVYGSLKSWGFDAFTEYCLHSSSWQGAMSLYRAYWNTSLAIARREGLHFWVPALGGYDATGYLENPEVFEPPSPEDFTAHLVEARAFAESNSETTLGKCLVYAWSEFMEGGILEPMQPGMLHNGDELLVAQRAAVAA